MHSQGEELKKMFKEAGGNFEIVEMNVKRWHEQKRSEEETESDVTKRMLRKRYFWDEFRAKCCAW